MENCIKKKRLTLGFKKKKKEKRKILVKRKKLGLRKRERETPVRTLSLFSFKKDHTLEFKCFLKDSL